MKAMCAELTLEAVAAPALCFRSHLNMPSAGLFHCWWLLLGDLHEMPKQTTSKESLSLSLSLSLSFYIYNLMAL